MQTIQRGDNLIMFNMGVPENVRRKKSQEELEAIRNGAKVMVKGDYVIYLDKSEKEILRVIR